MTTAAELPTGMAGLRYPITQVSLVVTDMDPLLERYHRMFGWAPWQDFDHVPPVHHNCFYQGKAVEYSLRGAEVYVGSLNFELLQPVPGGQSLFHHHQATRGDGIASIASMFHERADGDAVKVAFRENFGLEIINKADIGEHIEYYYADTQDAFGCPIESGSGHAIDFLGPARVYPHEGATSGPSPVSGITFGISQVTLVARDLDTKVHNYERAFGWGPWHVFDTRRGAPLSDVTVGEQATQLNLRFAQAMVGSVNYEIVEPLGGQSPWQEFLDGPGGGLMGVTVTPQAPATVEDVAEQFRAEGIGQLASVRVGDSTWTLFDTQDAFKTHIAVADGLAYAAATPQETVTG